jgi:transcription elongation factor Elf1
MYDFNNPYDDDKNKRDSRRNFTKSQQKKIFDKQKDHRCAICGEKLELSSTHYHHKKPWAKGGKTTVQNGIAVCANCHAKLHITEAADGIEKNPKKSKKKAYDPFSLDFRLPKGNTSKKIAPNPFDIDLGLPTGKTSKKKAYDPFSLDLGLPKGKKPKGGFGLF